MLALTDVFVHQVHTLSSILTRIAVALIQLILAAIAGIASIAVTGVTGNSVYAGAMMTWIGLAVIDVTFTESPLIT